MAIASHMSRGLREGGLIVLGAIALYLLIALLSYAPTAPGWSRSGAGVATLYAMNPLALPVNGGGVLGDVVAKGLIKPFNAAGAALCLLALFLTGVTLFTGLSWLWLMDVTGQRSLQGAGWMMGRWQRYRDEQAGQRARIAREQDVELEKKREKIKEHAPLRIEPVIKTPEPSVRVEKEKQMPLFKPAPSDGSLPPLALLDAAEPSTTRVSHEALE